MLLLIMTGRYQNHVIKHHFIKQIENNFMKQIQNIIIRQIIHIILFGYRFGRVRLFQRYLVWVILTDALTAMYYLYIKLI